jgi:hypothetical protein
MAENVVRLSEERSAVLRFLDARPDKWYCSECIVQALVLPSDRVGEVARLGVEISSGKTLAAGYEARRGGPCVICDAKKADEAKRGDWSLSSKGKTVRL